VSGEIAPAADRLAGYVARFPEARVLVVGDLVADEFVYGEIARASREAPVLILKYESTETVPGGAGNAAGNVASLGGRATLVGAVGRDRAGRATLLALRERGVDTSGVVALADRTTPTKTRILAGLAHSLRQQVIRVDREPAPATGGELERRIASDVAARVKEADVVVLSDYGYGIASPGVVDALRDATASHRVPLLVDSRFRLSELGGATSATPNEAELEELAGAPIATDDDVLAAGARIASSLELDALLVTRGSRGMALFERGAAPRLIPAVGDQEAIDVTGAGDTVIAAYALGIATGAPFLDAAWLANHAGGRVVMKRGTASVAPEELIASIEGGR
jgi:rfaE bifunctional protein kinase chain/domain